MLMGCLGSQEPKVVVATDYIEQSVPIQERPKGVSFPPVEWFIITEDNVETKIAEIEERTGDVAIFAITPKGYENLAIGIADLRRYVKEQQAIIGYYEDAVSKDDETEENTD